MLYQQDLLDLGTQEALDRGPQGELDEYAARLVRGVVEAEPKIDSLLSEHLSGWSLDRLGVLERAILRVAVYELLNENDVPVAVIVNEAVTLAKRFCSTEAGALVNGVLGNVAVEARTAEPVAEAPNEVAE